MNLVAYMADNAGRLPFLTEQHIELVLISVAISAVVGIGLALPTQSTPRLRHGMLPLTGTLLTIPSFALFALMIPLLGLGVAPTIAALAVYGVFPILRNTVTGIEGVDPAISRRHAPSA
jgi:osmoprotectant transport system permease protein